MILYPICVNGYNSDSDFKLDDLCNNDHPAKLRKDSHGLSRQTITARRRCFHNTYLSVRALRPRNRDLSILQATVALQEHPAQTSLAPPTDARSLIAFERNTQNEKQVRARAWAMNALISGDEKDLILLDMHPDCEELLFVMMTSAPPG